MLCDIDASFHANAVEPHVLNGSFHLSDAEDCIINEVKVELTGLISYLCPTFHNGNNFMDPEKPSFQLMETRFLNQSYTFASPTKDTMDYCFNLPHQFELTDSMRRRLGIGRATNGAPTRFKLPPSFAEEHKSYLQSIFVPWKEPSKASVKYTVKVTVNWHLRAGVGRLLRSNRHKSFRRVVTVVPPSTSDVQSLLPRYSGPDNAHWHREMVQIGADSYDCCNTISTSQVKLSLFSEHGLMLDHPLPFHLDVTKLNSSTAHTLISIDLIRTVSTKMRAGRREVERRNHTTLVNRLLVQACSEQAGESVDQSSDRLNNSLFDTDDGILRGTLSLLDDSSAKQVSLAPSFNFAGLTIEYRLKLHINAGEDDISFYTPAVVIESEPEPSPPPYVSFD